MHLSSEQRSRSFIRNKNVTDFRYPIVMLVCLKRPRIFLTLPFRRFLLVFFFAANCCFAQVDRAGLSGTVTDISGRRIPGVRIDTLETATGLQRETVSSASGAYDIPEL